MKRRFLTPGKWLCIGIPISFLLGAFFHYVFNLTGNNPYVGLFVPVNESIWEHLKLAFYPLLIWNIIGYFKFHRDYTFKGRSYLIASMLSPIVAPIVIVTFYYTLLGGFGIHSIILDIFSLLLADLVGQSLAYYTYKYGNFKVWVLILFVILTIAMIFMYAHFTNSPPNYPIFLDGSSGACKIH
ncbi:MAG: DUF6512 family protein [Clostridium sp.]|uniref:DUF6512 family protein n=1 Tax=Clostridium sp. TaxID=1506 RepID=UPI002FCA36A2